jgi:hypothetical protein
MKKANTASRETGVPRRPHCPLHVCVEMKLMDEAAPSWVQAAEDAEEVIIKLKRGQHHKRFKRKYWKCPVAGCFRVAAYAPAGEEEKQLSARKCPRCGAASDADGINRAIGRTACRNCLNEKQHLRRAAEEAKRKPRIVAELHAPFEVQDEIERTEEAVGFAETLLDAWRALPERDEARA